MFTSLNDIKINTTEYIEEYKETFESLIYQKSKDRTHEVDQMMADIIENKIFYIEGDRDFKTKTYDEIKELLYVKPGRLLIRELTKLVSYFEEPIHIKSGNKYFFHHGSKTHIEINMSERSECHYNALSGSNEVKCSKTKSITLAHELIHYLHNEEENIQKDAEFIQKSRRIDDTTREIYQQKIKDVFNEDIEIYPNPEFNTATFEGYESGIIFRGLDTLEEEHTILGVNIPRFLKKMNKLNKLDVLSENSFLIAFDLLPRVDHQRARENNLEVTIKENQNILSEYYHWLSQRINERNEKIDQQYGS